MSFSDAWRMGMPVPHNPPLFLIGILFMVISVWSWYNGRKNKEKLGEKTRGYDLNFVAGTLLGLVVGLVTFIIIRVIR